MISTFRTIKKQMILEIEDNNEAQILYEGLFIIQSFLGEKRYLDLKTIVENALKQPTEINTWQAKTLEWILEMQEINNGN